MVAIRGALRFKTCRLLPGNVRNRELSLIQRRILRRLRNKRRSIISSLTSKNSSQTTRKLPPLFYGDFLPIREMHRERTVGLWGQLSLLLNQETRSDVIPVRLHFSNTLPQARQPISHRRVCVNNGLVSITHFQVSHGDLIENSNYDFLSRRNVEQPTKFTFLEGFPAVIRRSFYIDISVGKIIGKFLPVRMWRRTKTEWFRLLKTRRGCRLLLKSRFLQELHSSMQQDLRVFNGSSSRPLEERLFLLLEKEVGRYLVPKSMVLYFLSVALFHRKSSVILEADRSQIPIASLVSSKIPLGRITYPIPANDPIQFIYLFRHSITKTVTAGHGA